MFSTRSTHHVVTATLFLDPHFAVGAWLGRPSDLFHIFLRCFVLIAHLLELMTSHTFMPLALVVEAYLGFALSAVHKWVLGQFVELPMTTTLCWTPQPVDS